jgi:hypothetical protein
MVAKRRKILRKRKYKTTKNPISILDDFEDNINGENKRTTPHIDSLWA